MKKKAENLGRTCGECKHHYDEHELDYKKEPFLCKCPFHKWSRFLNSPKYVCDKFEKQ